MNPNPNRRLFLRAMGLAIAAPALSRLIAGTTAKTAPVARPKAKRLEWQDWSYRLGSTRLLSSTPIGTTYMLHGPTNDDGWLMTGTDVPFMLNHQVTYPTLEAAKAAAQDRWNKTVLGALES